MTILVTGGAGFIGSNFVLNWCGAYRETVVNLDKLTYAGNLQNLAALEGTPRHVFVHGDIGDRGAVGLLLETYRPRAVIHFAAESHVDRSISAPEHFVHNNVVGTLRLLDETVRYWSRLDAAGSGGFRFLHVSTDEVYGSLEPDEPAFHETRRFEPNSPYSASKAASDHLVRAYHHTYRLPTLTTNCSNNYGPRQFPEKLIPLVITRALEGRAIPVYGDGKQRRDWLYVDDHCRAIVAVLEAGQPGETYNIGGNSEMRNIDVVRTICACLDELAPRRDGRTYLDQVEFVTDRPGHDRRYAVDTRRIASETGWRPREDFASGVRRTVRWYLSNQGWLESVASGAYRLPAAQSGFRVDIQDAPAACKDGPTLRQ